MKFLTDLILKMGTVDRRWIFLVIALVVIVPLFYPLGLPIRATATTQHVYDTIDALPHGSKVLVSCEYGPSTKPEIHPMVLSVMRHLFKNEHKVYVTCLWPDGQSLASDALDLVGRDEYGLTYGEDYVLLGFRPGNEAVVKGIVSNLSNLYTIDAKGTKISENP